MTETLALILYAIDAFLLAGAVVVQDQVFVRQCCLYKSLMLKPLESCFHVGQFPEVLAVPGQIKGSLVFALLLFSGAAALIAGRPLSELCHPPLV